MKIERFIPSRRFVMFLIAGGVNTLFYYAVYASLLFFGLPYPAAVVLANCCGIVFNFNTFGRFVFKNFDKRLFLRFVAVYAVLIVVGIAGIRLLLACGVPDAYFAGALMVVPTAALSYLLNRDVVFKS